MNKHKPRVKHLLAALALLFAPSVVHAQSALLQGGAWTAGHAPMYVGQGSSQTVVQDSGPAGGGGTGYGLSELLLTARGTGTPPYNSQGTGPLGTNICDYDAPTTNPTGYHFLCFSANAQSGGLLTYGAGGIASQLPLNFVVNGVSYQFPNFSAVASITVGTTGVNNGATNQLIYDNSGTVGEITKANSSILVSNGSGVPSWSTVIPAATQANITQVGTLTAGVWQATPVGTTYGGTGANLSPSNGAIVYSTGSTLALLAATVTANQLLMSGSSAPPAWSTATYPPTTTINQLLYSSGANAVAGLATANNGVLVTSGSGVPSISSTLPAAVQGNITAVGTVTSGTFNGNLTAGVTGIAGGTSTWIDYDNGGTLGQYAITGTGTTVAMAAGPTFTGVVNVAAGSAAAPSLSFGGAPTGPYSVSTTGFGISVNGTKQGDFGITNSGWTLAGGLTMSTGSVTANGGFLVSGNGVSFNGNGFFGPSGNGIFYMENAAATSFNRLQFGGSTSSFPSIKLVSATLAFRLADDSADAAISAAGITASGPIINSGITTDATLTDHAVCVVTGTGQFYYGSGSGGACLGTSSKRFKDQIADETEGLEQVASLEPKAFHYRDGYGYDPKHEFHGFIAEDVVKVLPQCVGLDSTGKPNTVDELCMLPFFVNAIKQQQAEIETLKQKVR